ncbi:MAG: TetR/AcrR family transcriptional regulator [Rhodoferax sp.]
MVAAALALAAQRSPADITTTDLARAVDISQGAVFKHFDSKTSIWLAVLDWTADALLGRLQAAAQSACATGAPPTDSAEGAWRALQCVFAAHVDFVVAYPAVPRIIFQELQSPADSALKARVQALMQCYRVLLMPLLERVMPTGDAASAPEHQAAVVLFIGAIQGLVMQALIAGDVSVMAHQAPAVFALVARGLGREPPGPGSEFWKGCV